jgi:hypothetical protein
MSIERAERLNEGPRGEPNPNLCKVFPVWNNHKPSLGSLNLYAQAQNKYSAPRIWSNQKHQS